MSAHMSSTAHQIPPFRIDPVFTARVWGSRDLRPWYDHVAQGDPIGEVWLTGDECRIATGAHSGKKLGELFAASSPGLLGERAPAPGSPLLLKVIFAREKLSVQVHPDDKLAQKYGDPRGKTECWYALAAEPGAEVAVGLRGGVAIDAVKQGIEGGTLEASLGLLPVAAGDMIFLDAGTVHAIWPGSVLFETQQNCDLTYRLYDYGRPRELHIEKGLEATRLSTRAGKIAPQQLFDRTVLIDVEYFRVERIPVQGSMTSAALRNRGELPGLAYLFAVAGAGRVTSPDFESVDLPARGMVAVPASAPEFAVEDAGATEPLELLRITSNWPR